MKNNEILIEGLIEEATFIERPNRFLVNLLLKGSKKAEPAFLHDPGRMKELLLPNVKLIIRKALNLENRKTKWDVLAVELNNRLVVIKSSFPNVVAKHALTNHLIDELSDFTILKPEITIGRSRLDFLLSKANQKCYVEVKGVTLVKGETAYFPDAPTERGTRHLRELIKLKEEGHRAVALFICMRDDPIFFSPNAETDPAFTQQLRLAKEAGVEVLVYKVKAVIKEKQLYLQFIDKVKVRI